MYILAEFCVRITLLSRYGKRRLLASMKIIWDAFCFSMAGIIYVYRFFNTIFSKVIKLDC